MVMVVAAKGGIVGKEVVYEQGGVELEGYHSYDDGKEGRRPGILIVHQWAGLSDYEKMRAEKLVELGYNVFAVDIYGKGVRPQPPQEAGEVAGKYKADRTMYRERLMAGLEILKNDARTEPGKIAAIGYCFGGTGVLELARAGSDLAGVVSFHGGLGAGEGMAAEKGVVKARVIAFHGALDPHVPPAEVSEFREEMTDAEADWQLVMFGGAVHSFTQKSAGDDASDGTAYDEKADNRSWEYMKVFLDEVFGKAT